jgi:hypothetical protein
MPLCVCVGSCVCAAATALLVTGVYFYQTINDEIYSDNEQIKKTVSFAKEIEKIEQ